MEDFYVNEQIEALCKQRNWTHYRLAKEAGISHSTLSQMMNGHHIPTTANLIKICNGFGITMSEFFLGIESRENNKNFEKKEELLHLWYLIDPYSRQLVLNYMYGLARQEIPNIVGAEQRKTNELSGIEKDCTKTDNI